MTYVAKRPTDIVVRQIAAANAQLAQIDNVQDAKEVHDKAATLHDYARRIGEGLSVQNRIARIRIEAACRAEELLAGTAKGRPKKGNTQLPLLSDIGISKIQSSRWQRMARVPAERRANGRAASILPAASSARATRSRRPTPGPTVRTSPSSRSTRTVPSSIAMAARKADAA